MNRQPGLKRLELRIELTYYLQVARTGDVVGGFDIVLKRVRDLDRKGEGEGAELIVGVGPVGDLFAKSFAECVGELRSRQVVTCNADRLANESVTASKDAERGPAEVLGSDRRRLTPSSAAKQAR